MSKKLILCILNAAPGNEQVKQIEAAAARNGHIVESSSSTFIFIPDTDTVSNSKKMLKGSLVEVKVDRANNTNSLEAASQVIGFIENNVTNQGNSNSRITDKPNDNNSDGDGDGVDWVTLNSLQHMKLII